MGNSKVLLCNAIDLYTRTKGLWFRCGVQVEGALGGEARIALGRGEGPRGVWETPSEDFDLDWDCRKEQHTWLREESNGSAAHHGRAVRQPQRWTWPGVLPWERLRHCQYGTRPGLQPAERMALRLVRIWRMAGFLYSDFTVSGSLGAVL